jgi:N-acetylglutamate synthase-like GNAT family acetyltransferase
MQYDLVDFDHFDLFVCERGKDILGVSAVDLSFAPTKGLLHGLFVLPIIRGHGIGKQLMQLGFGWAADNQLESVLMKAEGVSVSYFQKLGFEPLKGLGPNDYPYQFEKDLRGSVRLAQAS